MSLIIHDTISLTTASGVSKIQLCIGDITKLSKEEQADVLVVSAFPGENVTIIKLDNPQILTQLFAIYKTINRQSANIHSTHSNIYPNMEV